MPNSVSAVNRIMWSLARWPMRALSARAAPAIHRTLNAIVEMILFIGSSDTNECRSPSRSFLKTQRAPVRLGDLAAGREPKAVPARPRGEESPKDTLAILWGDSGPVVRDRHLGAPVDRAASRDGDARAREVEPV